MANSLIKIDRALPITSMSDLSAMGQLLAQSGMFGINNPAAGFVLAATCHTQGISPIEFKRTYHIIDGTPSMRADAMLAEFRNRGGRYKIIESSDTRAAAEFTFEKEKNTFEFTMEEAKKSGYCYKSDGKTLKTNWERSARNMLWARMASNAVRMLCPEIVAGIYTPEETEDMSADRDERNIESCEPVAVDNIADRVAAMKPANVEPQTQPQSQPQSEPSPFSKQAFDYSTCPIPGPMCGKKWSEMNIDHLGMAIQIKHELMERGHYEAIRDAANALQRGAK